MLIFAFLLALISCAPKPPAHGTAYVIEVDTNQLAGTDNQSQLLLRTQRVLAHRLRSLGVPGFFEQLAGTRILVKVAELKQDRLSMVRQAISAAGLLEFRMVHPENDELLAANVIDPGYEVLREKARRADGSTTVLAYLVNKRPERGLTGKFIKRAMVVRHPLTDEPEIFFEFDSEGAKIFEEITTQYRPKGNKYFHLAIVLDGVLYSTPRITQPIQGGRGQITGRFDVKEAMALANVLENPLEVPHRIIDERTF